MTLQKLLDEIKGLKKLKKSWNPRAESELKGIKETVDADNELIDLIEDVIVAIGEPARIDALFKLKTKYVKTLTIRQQIKEELNNG